MAEPTEEEDLMAIQAAHAALQTIADNRFLRSDEGHIFDYRPGTVRDAQRLAAFTLKRFTPVVCRLFADVGDDRTAGVMMSEPTQREKDLALLVKRLCRRLAPDDNLREGATDYLRREGLLGSPLRADDSGVTEVPRG